MTKDLFVCFVLSSDIGLFYNGKVYRMRTNMSKIIFLKKLKCSLHKYYLFSDVQHSNSTFIYLIM